MIKNLNQFNGLIFSQGVMLKLTQKGVSREEAYKAVQRNAMKTWEKNEDFKLNLKKDKLVSSNLTGKEIESLFDIKKHTKFINKILNRSLK